MPFLFLLFFWISSVGAQTQVPHVFEDKTPARAAEVNENFDAIETAIDSIAGSISTGNLENTVAGNGLVNNAPDDTLSYEYSGQRNSAVGVNALLENTGGGENTALGSYALYRNTIGKKNTAVGVSALAFNTEGFQNTAIGYASLLYNASGRNNTAVGMWALYSNTTAHWNVAIGHSALTYTTTGMHNTATGSLALYDNDTGYYNTTNGAFSLFANTSGYWNTAVGGHSLEANNTGWANTAIGYKADVTQGDLHNATAIGYNAKVRANNTVQIGDDEVTDIYFGQRATGSENQSGAADANLHLRGKFTTGELTYPNTDSTAGQVLTTDGSGNLGWAPDSDTLATIDCGQDSGFALIWNGSAWGCSANGSYVSRTIELEEQVAALEAQLQSQQEELLAIVRSQQKKMLVQQEQMAQLRQMVEHRFAAR